MSMLRIRDGYMCQGHRRTHNCMTSIERKDHERLQSLPWSVVELCCQQTYGCHTTATNEDFDDAWIKITGRRM
jgi:hypothetical protein